jgi:hypothetical protein
MHDVNRTKKKQVTAYGVNVMKTNVESLDYVTPQKL